MNTLSQTNLNTNTNNLILNIDNLSGIDKINENEIILKE
jgi:hypothetical protein